MSNLIKYNYIYFNGNEKKVIDSNNKSDTMISERAKKQNNETEGTEFVEGIGGIPIEKILVDREVLQEEQSENLLEEAKGKAEEIIQVASSEAEEIKLNAQQEAQQIKKSAYEEGYNNAIKEVDKLKEDLNRQIQQNKEEYRKELAGLEPKVVDIMAELIENITGILIEDKREVILHLVNKVIMNTESSRFTIKVSKEDYEFLQENNEKIHKSLSSRVQIEIIEEAKLTKNQCLIETESGVIDSSLDVQLNNLITDLRIMSSDV